MAIPSPHRTTSTASRPTPAVTIVSTARPLIVGTFGAPQPVPALSKRGSCDRDSGRLRGVPPPQAGNQAAGIRSCGFPPGEQASDRGLDLGLALELEGGMQAAHRLGDAVAVDHAGDLDRA